MSGLAIVSQGARRPGDRLGSRRVVLHRPAARARDRAGDRPRRRQRPRRRARWSSPPRSRRTTPSWAAADGPPMHRGELLGEVSRLKRSIAVAGTHGKTTTCGMVAHVLVESRPRSGLPDRRRAALDRLERGVGGGGVDRGRGRRVRSLVPGARARRGRGHQHRAGPPPHLPLAERAARRGTSRAFTERARGSADQGGRPTTAEDLELLPARLAASRSRGRAVELNVPGRHNVLNALAALAACREAGVPFAEAAPLLAGFTGAGRRFEERGATAAGARVFDDYAHHPTEVRATLEAARTLGARRVVACFQPHLFSRTRDARPGVRRGARPGRRGGRGRRLPRARARPRTSRA